MRYLNRLVWAAVAAAAVSAPASAQQGGGGQGGGGNGGSTIPGAQGLPGGGGGQGGGTGGQGGVQGQTNGTQLTQMEAAPQITAPGTSSGGGGSSVIHASNPFGAYFGNPQYQGIDANARANAAPGGFGQALYGNTTSAGRAVGGRTAGGAGGRIGGMGGRGGSTQSGDIIAQPYQLAFPAVPKFVSTPVAAPRLQADLTGMISRAPGIANPAGVQVLADGQTVTLRGSARDADEARVIAGMVRMTPGVREVRNELTFPK